MADRTQDAEITKVGNVNFLAEHLEADTSLDGMEQFVIIPRFKVVQAMSSAELKEKHGEGSIIVQPGSGLAHKRGDKQQKPLLFVPLMFFTEWCKWSDLHDKENPSIMERTFDPTSELAKRAADPKLRQEKYSDGTDKKFSYVQHFVFPGIIYGDHPLAGTQVTLSFERGEFNTGRAFISSTRMRRGKMDDGTQVPVPLWAQVWELESNTRKGEKGTWYGIDPKAPEVPIIDQAQADEFRNAHLELTRLHALNKVKVDHGDPDDEEGGESDEF